MNLSAPLPPAPRPDTLAELLGLLSDMSRVQSRALHLIEEMIRTQVPLPDLVTVPPSPPLAAAIDRLRESLEAPAAPAEPVVPGPPNSPPAAVAPPVVVEPAPALVVPTTPPAIQAPPAASRPTPGPEPAPVRPVPAAQPAPKPQVPNRKDMVLNAYASSFLSAKQIGEKLGIDPAAASTFIANGRTARDQRVVRGDAARLERARDRKAPAKATAPAVEPAVPASTSARFEQVLNLYATTLKPTGDIAREAGLPSTQLVGVLTRARDRNDPRVIKGDAERRAKAGQTRIAP
ncbi:hypothetical protein ACQVP2_07525 [Methylobacterium aquaticum]|uniref:hypothetical protein n=1 Tax=Methylobacterium aquaticum TaxID=270351 RepID=UPI003D185E30